MGERDAIDLIIRGGFEVVGPAQVVLWAGGLGLDQPEPNRLRQHEDADAIFWPECELDKAKM